VAAVDLVRVVDVVKFVLAEEALENGLAGAVRAGIGSHQKIQVGDQDGAADVEMRCAHVAHVRGAFLVHDQPFVASADRHAEVDFSS